MKLTNAIERKNILVIGDVMLDQYYIGRVKRISPEAPVPIFREEKERYVLGGAANVAVNLVAANQNVYMLSVVGADPQGDIVQQLLESRGIDSSMLLRRENRTTVKTRFLANNNQQIFRSDTEDTTGISEEMRERLCALFQENIARMDLIILSDYMKGLLSEAFMQDLIRTAERYAVKVLIDVKDANIQKYRGAYLLKPNLQELRLLTGLEVNSDEEIIEAARYLLRECACGYVLTTCGAEGMILVGPDDFYKIKSMGKEVYDVTGAGDTTIAYLGACLASGMDIKTSVLVSDCAAGVQVGKVGTSAVRLSEVENALADMGTDVEKKLVDREEVYKFRQRQGDKRIVFTNGCFDILHIGHVRYLQEAAKLGDVLIVGLNSDSSVRRLKGEGRPVNTQSDRAELLCALDCVDYVTVFEEDTPENLIRILQPDLLVKGGDYKLEEIVGREIVEARGGQVKLLPFVPGKSTSKIIHNIKGD